MSFELDFKEGIQLVKLARRAIVTFLETRKIIHAPSPQGSKLNKKCGVFVTINTIENGLERLRGCIGYPLPEAPLVEALIDSAIKSATSDPRFPSITKQELKKLILEVSVLTPPSQIMVEDPRDYVKNIRIGRDGLIVEKSLFKGLLLPQVPIEWKWDKEEFLANTCMKAGLPPDAWLTRGVKIYRFQAIVFKEKVPDGEVYRKRLASGE